MASETGSRNIVAIQYLRGVAAVMVVAHHTEQYFGRVPGWSDFGATGVDLFFVISGFIMAHSTRQFDETGSRALQAWEFALKRLKRIAPLYWIATALMVLLALFKDRPFGVEVLKDFVFWPRFNELRPGEIFPVLMPGWTINYEMFFYALFGGSMLFGRRRFWVLGGGLLLLPVVGHFVAFESAPAIFYFAVRPLEFLLGVAVYFLSQRFPMAWLPRGLALVAVAAGFGLMLLASLRAPSTLLLGLASGVIVWFSLPALRSWNVGWLNKIGDASYSIYLFHGFTLALSGRLLRTSGLREPTLAGIAVVLVVQTVVAVVLCWYVYRFVELPLVERLKLVGVRRHAAVARVAT